MLIRTHIAITIFGILILIQNVNHKTVFVVAALLAAFIPDADSENSAMGRKSPSKFFQFFTKHRGIAHSFIFLILITLGMVFIFPAVALGFFLGYGLHLFADSFTKNGITPFYPFSKAKSKGRVTTGGKFEIIIFIVFAAADLFLGYVKFF